MILQDLFKEYGYSNIEDDIDGERTGFFMNYFLDENDRIPSELLGIYLSKNQDELFFVLNGEGESITPLCQKWDFMIRNFMIFGSENREVLEQLQYNAVQLILFQTDIIDRAEELSLNISRKIFLRCKFGKTGKILLDSDEELELPFYLIESDTSDINQDLEVELKRCLPDNNPSLKFLGQIRKKVNKPAKSFSKNEYELIKRWLTEDEN